jgi:hypothetical protein
MRGRAAPAVPGRVEGQGRGHRAVKRKFGNPCRGFLTPNLRPPLGILKGAFHTNPTKVFELNINENKDIKPRFSVVN